MLSDGGGMCPVMFTIVSIKCQRDQIWQNIDTFGKKDKVLGNILRVYLVFVKIVILLWNV